MTIRRMDNVLIVVDDLEAAKAFFVELGMELEGETTVEGPSVVGVGRDPGYFGWSWAWTCGEVSRPPWGRGGDEPGAHRPGDPAGGLTPVG